MKVLWIALVLPPQVPAPSPVLRTDDSGRRAVAVVGADVGSEPAALPLQAAHWRQLGPFGGDAEDVQASPVDAQIVLAGIAPASGSGALYRSVDAGATWSEVAQLAGRPVYDVAFAPDGTAYLGTIDSVWKSTDGGQVWSQLDLAIGLNDQVLEVTVDPSDPLRLWIGVADALGNQPVNVMLSTNGGASWGNRTPPLPSPQSCTGVAVHPADPNRVYACFGGSFGGGQVWVSANGGASWTNRSAGLPNRPMKDLVHDGARVLLCGGQLFGGQVVGLYSSANEGVGWTALHDGTWPVLAINDVAVDPNHPQRILVGSAGAGVYLSANGGATWSFGAGGTGSLSVNSVAFSPGSSRILYTGSSSNAVWKSTDAAGTFSASSTGISRLSVYSIDANPQDPAELAIAFQGLNDGGVYASVDGGATWALQALPPTRYNTVRFAPDGRLHAISGGPSSIAPEGVYQRNGGTWSGIGPDQGTLFESELFGLRISANDPDLIIATGNDFGVAGFEMTAWRRSGGIWAKAHEGPANQSARDVLIATPSTDLVQLAAYSDFSGSGAGGVLRSTDGGQSWSPSNTGLPAGFQSLSIAASESPASFYAGNRSSSGGNHAVYRSDDEGQSWTGTGHLGGAVEVATDAFDAAVLYIAPDTGDRVLASDDGGASFAPHASGLAGSGFALDLQRASGPGGELLLATTTGSYATATTAFVPFCFGDGVLTVACPCANAGAAGRGCANSANAAGALLAASGATSPDTVVLAATGMPSSSLALLLQGQGRLFDGVLFGDGVRCAGGTLRRIASQASVGGAATYPGPGDPAISVRSAALGDVLSPGSIRYYQVQYRNSDPAFCPVPTGGLFNVTNGVQVNW